MWNNILNKLFLLLLGGGTGTICRYFLADWAQSKWGPWMPYGTFLVNMAGCLIMGILLAVLESRFGSLATAPAPLKLLLISGFLGGLTTFSSYELESWLLLREGAWERALLYGLGSLGLGLLTLVLAFKLGRLILDGRV